MVADFLPPAVTEIRDLEAIALLQRIQQRVIPVSSQPESTAIATAYVHFPPPLTAASEAVPLLLLHGFDSSLLEFRRFIPRLTDSHEIWAIDLLGAGFTAFVPPLGVNPQTIRQHLLSFIETCIHRPVILVGASLGGAVAIDFALHYPNWVRSLVLIDSVGFSGGFPIGQFLPHPLLELGADWLYFRQHAALATAAVLPMIDATLLDALRCAVLHQEMPGWKAAIASFTQSGGYGEIANRIPEITHPTLILWGEADDVLGTADASRFAQAMSNGRLIWVPQAGHAPHFDQPQVVADHLLAFARHPGN